MRTLASLCPFAFISVLVSFLSATAQDTTALQPISELPGNWVFYIDGSRLATYRSVMTPPGYSDTLLIYDCEDPVRWRLIDNGFRMETHFIGGEVIEGESGDHLGGILFLGDMLIATYNTYSEWGSADPGHSIGPLKVVARPIGSEDFLWEIILADDILEWENPDSGGWHGYTYPGDLARYGDYLFVAAGSWGIRIYDLSDLNSPELVDTLGLVCNQLALVGDRMVLITAPEYPNDRMLAVYDISEPTNPESVGEVNLSDYSPRLTPSLRAITKGHLYASTFDYHSDAELVIFDIQDDDAPSEVARTDLGLPLHPYFNLAVSDDRLYIKHKSAVHIFSLEEPTQPEQLGIISVEHPEYDHFAVNNKLLFLGHGESDDAFDDEFSLIQIYNVGPDAAPPSSLIPHPSSLLLSAYPNPFNSSTTIHFNLPTPGPVHLEVYDPLGRRVRELIPGSWLAAGEQKLMMKMMMMPSGRYVLRLSNGNETLAQKISLIK